MHLERLSDHVTHRQPRVERRRRVLEDHADALAKLLQLLPAQLREVFSQHARLTRCNRDQAEQGAANRRLTGARLAHEADDLAAAHVERDVVDRTERLLTGTLVLDDEVAALERHLLAGDVGHLVAELAVANTQVRHRVEEALGVGVLGVHEHFFRRALLDDVALEHDGDAVSHVGHHAHVVRNQQDAGVELVLQRAEEVEDVGLHRDVEGGGGLVGDDDGRVARERHGDHHALPHTAGELVGELLRAALRVGDAHRFEQVYCPGPGFTPECDAVHLHRLGELFAHPDDGVERGHRLLEHHRDVVAAHIAQLLAVELADALVRDDRLTLDVSVAGQQAEGRRRSDRFAGPRLADEGHDLAGAHVEGQPLHGMDASELRLELDVEILELQHCFLRHDSAPQLSVWRGSKASRRPSPMKLTHSAMPRMKMPGHQNSHGRVVSVLW